MKKRTKLTIIFLIFMIIIHNMLHWYYDKFMQLVVINCLVSFIVIIFLSYYEGYDN